MMLKKKSGFTLIELMVVIVIIGVLASLAIPRFTSASDKAKAAEAPRIIASYESAFLAGIAEYGYKDGKLGGDNFEDAEIMFDLPGNADGKTKFFEYKAEGDDLKNGQLSATAAVKLGGWEGDLSTEYKELDGDKGDGFERCHTGDETMFKKLLPNYVNSGDQWCS